MHMASRAIPINSSARGTVRHVYLSSNRLTKPVQCRNVSTFLRTTEVSVALLRFADESHTEVSLAEEREENIFEQATRPPSHCTMMAVWKG